MDSRVVAPCICEEKENLVPVISILLILHSIRFLKPEYFSVGAENQMFIYLNKSAKVRAQTGFLGRV